MSDVIVTAATAIANEWRGLAIAWHIVIAAVGAAVYGRRQVDARLVAGCMALMSSSVGAMAWWSGNPFNATVFGVTAIVATALAAAVVEPRLTFADRSGLAAGIIMCAFGWIYPHFLVGPAWQYAYAAPLGLIPCPTLAFIIGASLLTNSFGSKTWAMAFGALGLLYGLVGVFVLDVTIDWFLAAGAGLLLAREKRPLCNSVHLVWRAGWRPAPARRRSGTPR